MLVLPVGGGVYVPSTTPSSPASPSGAGDADNSRSDMSAPQQTAAAAQTARVLGQAQAAMAALQRLLEQGEPQAAIDSARQKAELAWGAMQSSVVNEMRVRADLSSNPGQAIKSAASEIRARAPGDQMLESIVTEAQQQVASESPAQRATGVQAFQYALAGQTAQGADTKLSGFQKLPIAQQRADGPAYASGLQQGASSADQAATTAQNSLATALQHEFNVQAASLRLEHAKASYAAWQKEPSGVRRTDWRDVAGELSRAQTQYGKVIGGDDDALSDLTDDEQQQAVALVKGAHQDDWYVGMVDVVAAQSALKRDVATLDPSARSLSAQEQGFVRKGEDLPAADATMHF